MAFNKKTGKSDLAGFFVVFYSVASDLAESAGGTTFC